MFPFFYVVALRQRREDGIWRIWSDERVRKDLGADKPEPIRHEAWWRTVRHALYFSILTAFHIGWRDVNVGNWIARMQPREYTLRATGWVRTVSGIQSLISVYLIALSVLTYFGRPFE